MELLPIILLIPFQPVDTVITSTMSCGIKFQVFALSCGEKYTCFNTNTAKLHSHWTHSPTSCGPSALHTSTSRPPVNIHALLLSQSYKIALEEFTLAAHTHTYLFKVFCEEILPDLALIPIYNFL